MEEEIQLHLDAARDLMRKAVEHTQAELVKIRAGKAMPNMLDSVEVEYYGSKVPVGQVSSVTTPDARTLAIKPFEKTMITEIERAIINSNLGFNPQNDGEIIRISIPMLTEDRRRDLMKQVKAEIESGKVSIRNVRKDTNNGLQRLQKEGYAEDLIKRAEDQVQKLTDKNTSKLDDMLVAKEKDIMTV